MKIPLIQYTLIRNPLVKFLKHPKLNPIKYIGIQIRIKQNWKQKKKQEKKKEVTYQTQPSKQPTESAQ
jgi:hypothetical protein